MTIGTLGARANAKEAPLVVFDLMAIVITYIMGAIKRMGEMASGLWNMQACSGCFSAASAQTRHIFAKPVFECDFAIGEMA